MKRLATAFVLIPATIWVIFYAPSWAFIAAMIIVGAFALREVIQIGKNPFVSAVGGVLYIGIAWLAAFQLRLINPHWLLFAFALCWVGDSAALYIGKNFGRHKLAPTISPSKTWEGAMASVVGGVLVGALYMAYFVPSERLGKVLIVAAAGNILGQFGDLLESAYKRWGGVKDSGTSLPGHGGWLDRIDSSLVSIPVVYALVWLYQ
jgi:phosphatidate cytidylyltransferase